MPDLGTPAPHVIRPASHTSTEQWQSFEIRMRHRRAERCVVRAEAALEAGLEDEARAALAEARALSSQTPDFETLRASVQQRQAAALAARKRATARRTAGAAALAATLVVGAIGLWMNSSGSNPDVAAPASPQAATIPLAPQHPVRAETPPEPRPPVISDAAPLSTSTEPESPVRTSGSSDLPASVPDPPAVPPFAGPASATPASQTTTPAWESPLPAVQNVTPSTSFARAPSAEALAFGSVPPPSDPDGIIKDLPTAAAPVAAPPPPAPARPADPEPAGPSEETKVRAVLARFEAAYSNLDASAAREVWPSVDGRSLERAFNSLQSQEVSLGRCSIVLNGGTAHAECSGTAAWTPRVGGGRHTEARHWRFDLASTNGSWQIVSATAR